MEEMTTPSQADVRRLTRELDIQFIRLQFTDILGAIKNVAIPRTQLDKALKGEIMFDGGSIKGFVRIEESDMLLKPDPGSFAVLPWEPKESGTARLICDIAWPDGRPFEGCPRTVLNRVCDEAAELGLTMMAGPEPEFFLFQRDDDGSATLRTHDQAGYFDLSPVDKGEDARRDIILALLGMGFDIEASHHEVAPAQHEIDFKYAEAVTTADRIATFRFVVRTIALRHGLHATFMPKPLMGEPGSGMHVHLSLFRGEDNAFYDPAEPNGLSQLARHFMAGLLTHARSFAAVTNPLVNSYKRLVPGFEAPVYVAWSEHNRSPLIRVPARRGVGTRLELRNPDPSCNPYLALAVVLKAGLDGIKRELEPPDPQNHNIYAMTPEERRSAGLPSLPATLEEALDELERSELMWEALGPHTMEHFLRAKRIEWDTYNRQVHRWEINRYLGLY